MNREVDKGRGPEGGGCPLKATYDNTYFGGALFAGSVKSINSPAPPEVEFERGLPGILWIQSKRSFERGRF